MKIFNHSCAMEWPERVCVVGNGPMSELDRAAIGACPFVIRFNDMKNVHKGEPTSLLVLRYKGPKGYHGQNLCRPQLPVLLVGHPGVRDPVPPTCQVVCRLATPAKLFGAVTTAPWGASTGAIMLQELQRAPSVQRLDIFGMNFAQSLRSKHIHGEKKLLQHGVSKMVLHPTPTNAYLPT
jgi:hypothetical protein